MTGRQDYEYNKLIEKAKRSQLSLEEKKRLNTLNKIRMTDLRVKSEVPDVSDMSFSIADHWDISQLKKNRNGNT